MPPVEVRFECFKAPFDHRTVWRTYRPDARRRLAFDDGNRGQLCSTSNRAEAAKVVWGMGQFEVFVRHRLRFDTIQSHDLSVAKVKEELYAGPIVEIESVVGVVWRRSNHKNPIGLVADNFNFSSLQGFASFHRTFCRLAPPRAIEENHSQDCNGYEANGQPPEYRLAEVAGDPAHGQPP